MRLINQKCDDGGEVPPVTARRAKMLLKELQLGWTINGKGHLKRRYLFKDFAAALAFAKKSRRRGRGRRASPRSLCGVGQVYD